MNCIAAVDKNWAIGNQGDLLAYNPIDMKFFRETTKGHIVVMGRKTLESFPGKKPLKNRINVVLSASTEESETEDNGTTLVFRKTVDRVLDYLKAFRSEDIFVIGGGTVYREFLPYCDTAYITLMKNEFQADTWFPDLEKDPDWEITIQGEQQVYEQIEFSFCTFKRK